MRVILLQILFCLVAMGFPVAARGDIVVKSRCHVTETTDSDRHVALAAPKMLNEDIGVAYDMEIMNNPELKSYIYIPSYIKGRGGTYIPFNSQSRFSDFEISIKIPYNPNNYH